jgi:hypothetical protein
VPWDDSDSAYVYANDIIAEYAGKEPSPGFFVSLNRKNGKPNYAKLYRFAEKTGVHYMRQDCPPRRKFHAREFAAAFRADGKLLATPSQSKLVKKVTESLRNRQAD